MIIWAPRAIRDLREAYLHYAESNERAAERINAAIVMAGGSLSRFPRRGRHGRQSGTRELIVQTTRYCLVYRIARSGDVRTTHVMHMARDWPRRR